MIYISGDDACAYKNVRSEHYTWATKDNIEVQAVDTNGGVVLDTKINVFLNTKTKVSGVTEVVFPQLIFPNFQPSFKDFFSFGSTDRAVDSDLFVTTNTERTHSVASFGEDGLLARKLFQHL